VKKRRLASGLSTRCKKAFFTLASLHNHGVFRERLRGESEGGG
jgi:hypothetical protein